MLDDLEERERVLKKAGMERREEEVKWWVHFDGSYMGHRTYVSFIEDISSRFENATGVKHV
jgi:hypothetical protein